MSTQRSGTDGWVQSFWISDSSNVLKAYEFVKIHNFSFSNTQKHFDCLTVEKGFILSIDSLVD